MIQAKPSPTLALPHSITTKLLVKLVGQLSPATGIVFMNIQASQVKFDDPWKLNTVLPAMRRLSLFALVKKLLQPFSLTVLNGPKDPCVTAPLVIGTNANEEFELSRNVPLIFLDVLDDISLFSKSVT